MTISTSSDFKLNRDAIIAVAMSNVGAVGPGESVEGDLLVHGNRVLNTIVKSWDALGAQVERIVRRTLATVDGQAAYALGVDVVDIDGDMNFSRSGSTSRSTISQITRREYMALTDRTTEAQPSLYFVEKLNPDTVTVTFWNVPDATGDSIEYAAVLRAKDFDTGADDADFSQKWMRALTWQLSADLAPAFGQLDASSRFSKLATEERDRQINDNHERGNMTLVPFDGAYC